MWQKFLCELGIHSWSRWSEAKQVEVRVTRPLLDITREEVSALKQIRTCECCGRSQLRFAHAGDR